MLFRLLERHRNISVVVILFGAYIWTLLVQAPANLPAMALALGWTAFIGVAILEISACTTGGKHVPMLFYISLMIPIVLNLGGHLMNALGSYEIGEPMRAVRFGILLISWISIYAYWQKMAEPMRKRMMDPPTATPPSTPTDQPPQLEPRVPTNSSGINCLRMVWARL